jgi:formiminotetrahydrofolate cyclodeaminase
MADSIWRSTLEEFRGQIAGSAPVPAGVSVAAVSATLGLSLLMKVLEITRKRKDFSGDPRKIEDMLTSARTESERLHQYADDDVLAYAEYMATRNATALRKAIEVPLEAARSAASGIKLCADASEMAPASVAPDLGTATILLAGAVRSILLSVESNALHLTDREFQLEVQREVETLKQLAKKHQQW